MCKSRSLVTFLLLLCSASLASAAQGSTAWQTLDGNAPLVIAHGGFSGLFPDSSSVAYQFAGQVSLANVIFWCDVQLTKDAAGVCAPNLNLANNTDISSIFPNQSNTYSVNGVSIQGWFSVDFTLKELASVNLIQGVFSRPNKFDGVFPVVTVNLIPQFSPPGLWLNVEHDVFFTQRNLSMRSFVLSVFKSTIVDYVSSPEVSFLKGLVARLPTGTKLIYRFLGRSDVDPSINQTYGSLLSNLTFIKTFASGILVPKSYIWPVDASLYLLPHTTLVSDAHKAGLEVFASDFANDAPFAYDFSFDPVAESLSFIDNGNFTVDGMLSDFPITQSEAIACFAHIGKNVSGQESPLVISSKGASGDFPGCTDLAYQGAISDGVDILDCPVQMTKDGIAICLGSINLLDSTLVAQSPFSNLSKSISELGISNGIFTFSLTWSQIQTLTPAISNPYANYRLTRDPIYKNAGKFTTLSEFLVLAKNASSVSGVLISIEDAAYLAEYQGLDVTDVVLGTLQNASFSTQKVMIQSTNSSVLTKLKKESNYELIYVVDENIGGADNSSVAEIKTFASAVVVSKSSVFTDNAEYLTGMTNVVQMLQAFQLQVFVQIFRNEFVSQAWDFFSDATVEINSYVMGAGIDGVVTEFPGTAARYKKNRCLGLGSKTPSYMSPVQPDGLYQVIPPTELPPAEAPNPLLTESEVVEAPLPPVAILAPPPGNSGNQATPPTKSNAQLEVVSSVVPSFLAFLIAALALF
ncbi:glycerophosphodiester phosphodiesterase GDPDL3-like [Rhododendron vialii]|uniref:glycerophosphodiester phosphodiesterase GDPDL3-like n=1 Tax=Rhododendron vialii TaxID=182163 RepID=UPI00265F4A00|nr:glycerophosphodiester phosphodiesterase GDPDL3-like [Rhododendron vialii]